MYYKARAPKQDMIEWKQNLAKEIAIINKEVRWDYLENVQVYLILLLDWKAYQECAM